MLAGGPQVELHIDVTTVRVPDLGGQRDIGVPHGDETAAVTAFVRPHLGAGRGVQRPGCLGRAVEGLPTAAIRYENGREYREEVTAYDNAYRVKAARTVIPAEETGLGGTYEYKYGYTPTGNLAFVQPPGVGGLVNETIVFRYNSDGLPISIGGTASYLNDVKYSAFGEVLRKDAGVAGRKVHGTYLYDEFTRRLTEAGFDRSVNPGHIGATQYAYDDAGNVTQIKDTPGAAAPDNGKTDTQCFVYNQLRQMTSAWTAKDDCQAPASKDTVGGPDPYWQTYAFDEAGNRKQLVEKDTTGDTTKDVTRTYTYGKPGIGGPNALAEIKSTGPGGDRLNTFGYDDAGNTTTRQHNGATQTLEWNVEGELASVSEPTEGGGVKKTSYLYGADGSRLIRAAADGSKTLYLGEAELKVSADGTTKTAERFYPHPDGSMTVRATGGGRQLMLSDHHGSSNTTVDLVSVGMPVTRRKLMPFGEQRGAQPSTWPGSRGLVGGTVDQDTGLTRLGARDYDPTIGRFLSIDPLVDYGEPATINPYAYSNNAPRPSPMRAGSSGPSWVVIGLRAGQIALRKAAQRRLAQEALRKKMRQQAQKKAAAKKRAEAEARKRAKAKAEREAAKKRAAAKRAAAKKAAQKRAAERRASQRRSAAQAKIRSQRAAAKREAAKRAAARKAAARPKPNPRPRSQPRPRLKPSQAKKPAQKTVRKAAREAKSEGKQQAGEAAQQQGAEWSEEQEDPAAAARYARDLQGHEDRGKHPAYTGGFDPSNPSRVFVGCSSNPSGCAEQDVERQVGRGPAGVVFTKAFGWRAKKWVEIPICVRCQARYKRSQFPPDATYDQGGDWSK